MTNDPTCNCSQQHPIGEAFTVKRPISQIPTADNRIVKLAKALADPEGLTFLIHGILLSEGVSNDLAFETIAIYEEVRGKVRTSGDVLAVIRLARGLHFLSAEYNLVLSQPPQRKLEGAARHYPNARIGV